MLKNILVFLILSQFTVEVVGHAAGLNCSLSLLCHDQQAQIQMQKLKDHLLSELHMPEAPVNVKMPSEALLDQYRSLAEDIDNGHAEETETRFVTAKDPSNGEDESQLVAAFEVGENLAIRKLVEARLMISVDLPDKTRAHDVQIQVYEKNEDGSMGELVITETQSIMDNQKIRLTLPKEDVIRWYTTSPILGLFVSAIVNGHNVAIHPQQSSEDHENMLLQLTMVKAADRNRRWAAPVCTKENPSLGCCMYDLMIDFEEIGWNWIVAPKRYNAYMCRGDCQLNKHHYTLNENGHTKILKAAYRMGAETRDAVGQVSSCCHASDYEYIKMIYVNRDGHVSIANVNGMIARRCQCS